MSLFAALAFKPGYLVGDFRNALPQLRLRTVLHLTVAETVARYMQLKFGLEILALST